MGARWTQHVGAQCVPCSFLKLPESSGTVCQDLCVTFVLPPGALSHQGEQVNHVGARPTEGGHSEAMRADSPDRDRMDSRWAEGQR